MRILRQSPRLACLLVMAGLLLEVWVILALACPAYAAESVDASPVVTVAGSQMEGTVTISAPVVLSSATVDALASAFSAAQVPTVSVTPSPDDDSFRASVLVALAVSVALLGALVAGVLLR